MSPLEKNSEEIADTILEWYVETVKDNYALRDILNQLVRSGTSIGANIAESKFAQSDSDYKSKMAIALKEANETKYWIKRCQKIHLISDSLSEQLNKKLDSNIRMLISVSRKDTKQT